MKLVPKRRFKGFSGCWKRYLFNDLLDQSDGIRRGPFGSALKKETFVENSDYVVYEQQNAIYDTYETRYNITEEKYNGLFRFKISAGDFIMSGAGTIGRISKVPEDVKPGVINQALIRLKINQERINSDYFLQWIRSERMQNRLTEANPASAMVNLVPMSEVKNWKVYAPSVNEQKQIGIFFCSFDNLISFHQQKLRKLQAMKQAYLHEMFPAEGESVPKRRFAGFEQPWKMKKLDDLGATFSGLLGKTKQDFGKGKAEFVPYLNVFNNPVSDIHYTEQVEIDKRQNEVRFGDVFFTTSSETPEEVGMSSVWLDDRKNVYLNSFCFGYRLRENVEPLFMAYVLRTNPVRNQFVLLAQGISRYNISSRKAMEITINFPELGEQRAIGHFFSLLDKRIEMQEAKIEKLKAMKKAYLEEMFV